jgi:hypothetical protein
MTLSYPTSMGSVRKFRRCCTSSRSQVTSLFSAAEEATLLNACGSMAMVFVFSPSVWREVVLSGRRLQKELFV